MAELPQPAVTSSSLAPARSRRFLAVLVVAILAAITAISVLAARLSDSSPPALSQTAVEGAFLHIMNTHDANVLALGHLACQTMTSGKATHAEYRTAEGRLMFYRQIAPAYASMIVHSALSSGLCTEHGADVLNPVTSAWPRPEESWVYPH